MALVQLFWPYVRGRMGQVALLQLVMLLRPVVGGIGFILVVPAMQQLGLSTGSSNHRLNELMLLLPTLTTLTELLLAFFVVMLVAAILSYIQAVVSASVEQQILLGLRTGLYQSVMHTQWQHIARISQADYTRILSEEVEAINAVFHQLIAFVSQLCLIGTYTIFCLYLSPGITAMALLLGVVMLLTTLPIQKLVSSAGSSHLDSSEDLYRLAGDQVKGLRVIKSSGTEGSHIRQFSDIANNLSRQQVLFTQISSLTFLMQSTVSAAAFCLLAYTAFEIVTMDTATIAVLALVFARLMPQVTRLPLLYQYVAYLLPSVESVASLMRTTALHQEAVLAGAPETEKSRTGEIGAGQTFDLTQGITLQAISYTYPDSQHPVLRQFNAHLGAGQIVAVTGRSGIGKSTLADILSGMTLADTGYMSIGDSRITETELVKWRSQVTYLPQTPFLTDATIRENLNLFLKKPASDTMIEQALADAAAEFVSALPAGVDTNIGDNGIALSGGERQRLQFARALLVPRPVIILDETTSNLDLTSEEKILATVERLKTGRIIIIISHRPSIRDIADQVLTIDP